MYFINTRTSVKHKKRLQVPEMHFVSAFSIFRFSLAAQHRYGRTNKLIYARHVRAITESLYDIVTIALNSLCCVIMSFKNVSRSPSFLKLLQRERSFRPNRPLCSGLTQLPFLLSLFHFLVTLR
jgi:hypothetical protein